MKSKNLPTSAFIMTTAHVLRVGTYPCRSVAMATADTDFATIATD
jgi:hypothetical protein